MPGPSESYDEIRLESPSGEVIVYLAPTFEVNPTDQNEIFEGGRPTDSAIVLNNGLWTSELVAQGSFLHSDEFGEPFRSALQDLHGQQTVTPMDQINRLRSFTVYSDLETLNFYHRDNEYTATSDGDVDVDNGVYPAVVPTELRTPEEGETSATQTDFTIRLAVGTSRGGEEPTEPDI